MSRYAKVAAPGGAILAHPYTYRQFRDENKMVSYPRDPSDARLADFGIYPVADTAQPAYDLNFNIVEGEPVWVNGALEQVWTQVAASPAEIAERTKAEEDQQLLADTKADAFIQTFIGMTDAEIGNYIDANATNLAGVRGVLKKYGKLLHYIARREYGD
jgi:hypothetical protein